MRNKKIQILLVFVLAIGLFGLLFYWRYGEKKQMESLNGLQETYKEWNKCFFKAKIIQKGFVDFNGIKSGIA